MTMDTVHYTVFRHHKNKAGKTIYYAHFYDPETGMRLPAISTRQTNKRSALDWCFQKALSGEFKRTKEIPFREFTTKIEPVTFLLLEAFEARGKLCLESVSLVTH